MALRRQTNITQRLDNEEYLVYTASNGSVYRKDGSFRTSITPLESLHACSSLSLLPYTEVSKLASVCAIIAVMCLFSEIMSFYECC